MKLKIYWIVLLILATTLVSASIEVEHKCPSPLCVEGEGIDFVITIGNNLNQTITIHEIALVEENSLNIIAQKDLKENLAADKIAEYTIKTKGIMPKEGFTYFYYPCIKVSFSETNKTQKLICSEKRESLTLTPRDKVDCFKDSECEDSKYCHPTRYKCTDLECAEDEAILPHKCMKLSCPEGYENHQCKTTKQLSFNYQPYLISIGIILLIILIIVSIIFIPKKKKIVIIGKKKIRK